MSDQEQKISFGTCVYKFLENEYEIKHNKKLGEKELTKLYENTESFVAYIARKTFSSFTYRSSSLSKQLKEDYKREIYQREYDQKDQIKDSVLYLFKAIVLEPEDLEKEFKKFVNDASEKEKDDRSYQNEVTIRKTMIRISSKIRDIYKKQNSPENIIFHVIAYEIKGLIRANNRDIKNKNLIDKINSTKDDIKSLVESGDLKKVNSILFEAAGQHKVRNKLRIEILKYFQKRYPHILDKKDILFSLSNFEESMNSEFNMEEQISDSLKDLLNYDYIKEEKSIFILKGKLNEEFSIKILSKEDDNNKIENQIKRDVIEYFEKIYPYTLIKKDFYFELTSFKDKKIPESEYKKVVNSYQKELIKSGFIEEKKKQKGIFSLNAQYKEAFSKDIFWDNLLRKEQQKTNKGIKNIIIEFMLKNDPEPLTEKYIATEISKVLYSEYAGKDGSLEDKFDYIIEEEDKKGAKNSIESANDVVNKTNLMKASKLEYIEKEADYCLEEYIDEVELNVVNSFKIEKSKQFIKCKMAQANIALMIRFYLKMIKESYKKTNNMFKSIAKYKFANLNDETECIKEILNGKKFQDFIISEIGKEDTVSDGTVSSILNQYSLAAFESINDSCYRGYHCEEGEKIITKFIRKLVTYFDDLYLEVIGEKK